MSRVALLCLFLFAGASLYAQKECSTTQYEEALLAKYPTLRQEISAANEALKSTAVTSGAGAPTGILPVINIPVVVHVLYKEAAQNISDEQILSQIDALNKAFQLQHADTSKIPAYFRELAANCRITFCLAKVDPKGFATSGIVRKSTWVSMFGMDDRIKYSNQGGDDAWPADKYLNIWTGNLAGGLLGYSSVLGGPADRDGVVIRPNAFGTLGNVAAPFHQGKTAVHEIGHWLGLRHIWGDATCGDDLVDDTPQQRAATRGCPSGIKQSCGANATGDMYMNYMDLTDDQCMFMFTAGQMNRMRNAFAAGGPRAALLSSNGCSGTPLPQPIEAPVVEKPAVKLFTVYPNPVQHTLYIDVKENAELLGAEVKLLNQFGQPVQSVRIAQSRTAISVAHLARGVYFIKVDGGNYKYQEKFLKL